MNRKFTKHPSLYLLVLLSVIFTACQKEEEDPLALPRDKFIGSWSVTSQHSLFGTKHWNMRIRASNSSPDQILIDDFNLFSGTVTYADVSGSQFVIPGQIVSGETVEGLGSYLSNGTLSFSYTSDDGVAVDSVTATATKI